MKNLIQSKPFIALFCLILGAGSMFAIQRLWSRSVVRYDSGSQNPDHAIAQNRVHSFESLDQFFDDDFFKQPSDPFDGMRKMRQYMLKQFQTPGLGGNLFDSWYEKKFGGGNAGETKRREDNQFVYYDVSVKGLQNQKLDVSVKDGQITISGKTESKTEEGNAQAYSTSIFRRSFPIPPGVDAQKFQMEQEKDKLIIKFPKKNA